MPSRIAWHVEQRVLLLQYWGDVSVVEMNSTTPQIAQYIQHNPQVVDLVVDLMGVTRVPTTNITHLNHSARILFSQPNLDYVVGIFGNKVVAFFAQAVLQMQHRRSRVVSSWQDAVRTLQSIDATLPPLPETMPEGHDLYRYQDGT